VSRTRKEYVDDGKWASMMNVTLTSDHRVIDGAIASKWLEAFKNYIENPLMILI